MTEILPPPQLYLPTHHLRTAVDAAADAVTGLTRAGDVSWRSVAAEAFRSEVDEALAQARALAALVEAAHDEWQRTRRAATAHGQL